VASGGKGPVVVAASEGNGGQNTDEDDRRIHAISRCEEALPK
jgi:hypothetical protein